MRDAGSVNSNACTAGFSIYRQAPRSVPSGRVSPVGFPGQVLLDSKTGPVHRTGPKVLARLAPNEGFNHLPKAKLRSW